MPGSSIVQTPIASMPFCLRKNPCLAVEKFGISPIESNPPFPHTVPNKKKRQTVWTFLQPSLSKKGEAA